MAPAFRGLPTSHTESGLASVARRRWRQWHLPLSHRKHCGFGLGLLDRFLRGRQPCGKAIGRAAEGPGQAPAPGCWPCLCATLEEDPPALTDYLNRARGRGAWSEWKWEAAIITPTIKRKENIFKILVFFYCLCKKEGKKWK